MSKGERVEESLSSFEHGYVIGECGHRRMAALGATGYRCEKHGGSRVVHTRAISNGSTDNGSVTRKHRDTSYSDTGMSYKNF